MLKKSAYGAFGFTGLLLIAYLLQPLKRGRGFNATTHYERVKDWPQLPDGFRLGNPTGMSLDTGGNLVVFHRAERNWPLLGAMPDSPIQRKTIIILDKETGRVINSWGGQLFIMPHGLTVDRDNNIWVTDVGLHQVFKFSYEGKLLLKIGEAKMAGNDSLHFNQPTDVAVAKGGSFYVSDGYGNSRIIKFSASGKYLFSWGKRGSGEGEFDVPHGLALDDKGNVYVADRENNRTQMFDAGGQYLRQFTEKNLGAVCAVVFDPAGPKLVTVDDVSFLGLKHRGSDVVVFDTTGKPQTRFGRSGAYDGPTSWYHDLAVDSAENIYVSDILGNTLQKFIKVAGR